jgi:hypothetical protein
LHHAGVIKIRIANKNKSAFFPSGHEQRGTNREAYLQSACGDKPEQE